MLTEKLVSSDGFSGDVFGGGLGICSWGIVVGAPGDSHSGFKDVGSAYVFEAQGSGWAESDKLIPADLTPVKAFGSSVSIDSDTMVIGAYGDNNAGGALAGAAYLFRRIGNSWVQDQKIVASDAQAGAGFGYRCSLDEDMLVVTAPFHDLGSIPDSGAIYVFTRAATGWSEEAKLIHSGAANYDQCGTSASVRSGRIAVGCANTGTAYIFERTGGVWTQSSVLMPSDAQVGDGFGVSLALGLDEVLIGALYNDHAGGQDAGAVYRFEAIKGVGWVETQKLVASDTAVGAWFGACVAVDGGTLIIGAPGASYTANGLVSGAGEAYIFKRSGNGSWTEHGILLASDPSPVDRFGSTVAVFGCRVAVSAPGWEPAGKKASYDQGAAYVFEEKLAPQVYCTAGVSAIGCNIHLSAFGSASATASSGFQVTAGSVPGATTALVFFGTGAKNITPWASTWGNATSFRCFQPPAIRLAKPLLVSGGSTACNSSIAIDINSQWCPSCPRSKVNPGEGAIVRLQLWMYDPGNQSNTQSVLSDALEFCVGP